MTTSSISDAQFGRLKSIVYDLTGVTMDDSKRSMLSSRIRRRLRALELDDASEYIKMLARGTLDDEEVIAFIAAVTTHKTSFFRTPSIWAQLRDEFSSDAYSGKHLDVWSAASSTGQEPYSLAMLLRTLRGADHVAGRWRVTASDVSPETVGIARKGEYDRRDVHVAAAENPKVKVSECFDIDGQTARVKPEISAGVNFTVHNLMHPMKGTFDAVLLRNVIIYFSGEDTDRVVRQVIDTLKPGGLLVMGESESMISRDDRLEYEAPCVYRKKR